MHQALNDFLVKVKQLKLIERYPHHEIYLWSNFWLNEDTPDIDLKFVGEVSEEMGLSLRNFHKEWIRHKPLDKRYWIDFTMYTDTKLFEHIPRFNRCKEDRYYFDEDIYRYKIWKLNRNEENGRELTQLSDNLFKVKQIFARKDTKYKDRDWTYPILLKNLL